MIKVKDGYVKLINTSLLGNTDCVLISDGGHRKIGNEANELVQRNSNGQIESTVLDISPFVVTSQTVNNNLNADLLDGYHVETLFEELSLSSSTLTIKIGGTSKDIQLPTSKDEKVKQTSSTTDKEFPILLSYSDNPTSGANSTSLYSKKVTVNPSTGILTTSGLDFTGKVILGSNSIGASTQPIYLNGGQVTPCDFKIWKGTADQYSAISSKDSNTLYFIY